MWCLLQKKGWESAKLKKKKKGSAGMAVYNALVIGGGPAGAAAALTLRNRNKTVAVVANPPETTGLSKAPEIRNYPGLSASGREMQARIDRQLQESGAEILPGRALSVASLGLTFGTAVGNSFYESESVILCLGMPRSKGYPGEEELLGKGVSYCATCDGMLYKGKKVAVLGSGEETEKDIQFLESIGCTVIHPTGKNIRIEGTGKVERICMGETEVPVSAVFIRGGRILTASLVQGLLLESGQILVNANMETNIPGIYAAGDCTGAPYQLAKAVGQGNVAGYRAAEYVENKRT